MNKKLHVEQSELLAGLGRLNNRTNLMLQMSGLIQEHVILNQRLSAHILALNQEIAILYANQANSAVSKPIPGPEPQRPNENCDSPGGNCASEPAPVPSNHSGRDSYGSPVV